MCGTRFVEVLRTGRVGCSTCYGTFLEQLKPLLQMFHVRARHCGKAPQADDVHDRICAELQTKRALLRSLVRSENYEDAAVLRDEIRKLEAGLRARKRDTAGSIGKP